MLEDSMQSKISIDHVVVIEYNPKGWAYDFLYINMDEPFDTMYHQNFNKLILGGV
jgi:hypothetical protein